MASRRTSGYSLTNFTIRTIWCRWRSLFTTQTTRSSLLDIKVFSHFYLKELVDRVQQSPDQQQAGSTHNQLCVRESVLGQLGRTRSPPQGRTHPPSYCFLKRCQLGFSFLFLLINQLETFSIGNTPTIIIP